MIGLHANTDQGDDFVQSCAQTADVLARFDQYLNAASRSPATRRAYVNDMMAYNAWVLMTFGEPCDLGAITPVDVRAWRDQMVAEHVRPATINRRLTALSVFCEWAVGESILATDPTEGIKGVKQQKSAPRALDRIEVNRIKRKAMQSGNPLHAAVVVVLANAGLRVAELCALTLDDVNIGDRSGWVTVHGKGSKERRVPLNPEARQAIVAYTVARPPWSDNRLFIAQRGPLTTSGAWRIVRKYARAAGVECSPHVLRHTFATRLLREADADLVTVSDLLGHDDIKTTAVYTRSNERDQQRAVDSL